METPNIPQSRSPRGPMEVHLGVAEISLSVFESLLKLPDNVYIERVIQEFNDEHKRVFRILLKEEEGIGKGILPLVTRGTKIPDVTVVMSSTLGDSEIKWS